MNAFTDLFKKTNTTGPDGVLAYYLKNFASNLISRVINICMKTEQFLQCGNCQKTSPVD